MIWGKYHTETYADLWQTAYRHNMNIEFNNYDDTVTVTIPDLGIEYTTNNVVDAVMGAIRHKEIVHANRQ
jgi:hypothetical protein